MSGVPYPDLLVALNAYPAACRARNGYVISEQGKPPDFVLEIASASSGRRDTVDKRITYADLGIPEYWRFDENGRFHGTRLAGDRLVGGQYEPIQIDELSDGSLQGHSAILNVDVRWVEGHLVWYDPATGEPIATLDTVRQAFDLERGSSPPGRSQGPGVRGADPPAEGRMTATDGHRAGAACAYL